MSRAGRRVPPGLQPRELHHAVGAQAAGLAVAAAHVELGEDILVAGAGPLFIDADHGTVGREGACVALAGALVQYLQSVKRVDPAADGNLRTQPVPGVKLRFTSGAGGIAHRSRQPQLRLVKDKGSALYELAH